MLELGAVYLDASTRIAEQRLGHGLDYASLARAGRPQEQQVPDRPSCRVQASQKRLVDFGNLLDCRILTYNLEPQCGFEFPRIVAAPRGIQGCVQSDFHNAYHSPAWSLQARDQVLCCFGAARMFVSIANLQAAHLFPPRNKRHGGNCSVKSSVLLVSACRGRSLMRWRRL